MYINVLLGWCAWNVGFYNKKLKCYISFNTSQMFFEDRLTQGTLQKPTYVFILLAKCGVHNTTS